jgi:2-(1,2-epoxy-1,2-dihydrophenyl)acetyl-CoA isomerase
VDIVEIENHGRGIVRVVMNHSTARNALGEELRGVLLTKLAEIFESPKTRVIIIASALKDFSVGGDLSRMDELVDPKIGRQRLKSAHRLARLFLANEKPLIAEVNGHAVGAGAGLALVCDTIVIGENANIGFSFFKVGLVPDFLITHTLPQRMGLARARQALLYARSYKGPEALRENIADVVVADEAVGKKAMELAQELAALPSQAISLTKRMLEIAENPPAVLDFEAMAQPLCFASDDFKEGLAAFREKRAPNFDPDIE